MLPRWRDEGFSTIGWLSIFFLGIVSIQNASARSTSETFADTASFEFHESVAQMMDAGSHPKYHREVITLPHWEEVLYGEQHSSPSKDWVDPLSNPNEPVRFGFNKDGKTSEESLKERNHREGRFLSEVTKRKLLAWTTGSSTRTLGLGSPSQSGPTTASVNASFYRYGSQDLSQKPYVDWRLTNAITPVKNQGQCSSCSVIAAMDTITILNNIGNGYGIQPFNTAWSSITYGSLGYTTTSAADNYGGSYNGSLSDSSTDVQLGQWGSRDFSVQQYCDCAGGCCQGGWPESVFMYSQQNGLASWPNYPYVQADTSTCLLSGQSSLSRNVVNGWEWVPAMNPDALRKALDYQPVLVLISATTDFQTYLGGFFNGNCNGDLNHVVAIVGYGMSTSGPYFIIKNSWGSSWGDNGYMYISADTGAGRCNMLMAPPMYPTNWPNANLYPWPYSAHNLFQYLPNPCAGGSPYLQWKWWPKWSWQYRCKCPANYVENMLTTPPKCVPQYPCNANPGPCGGGTCNNLADGTYSCTCLPGYTASARTDGSATCAPNNDQGGSPTVTVPVGTTVSDVAQAYDTTVANILELNPWLSAANNIPPGSALSLNSSFSGAGCGTIYTSQEGDTWDSVASAFGIGTGDISTLNPLLGLTQPLVSGLDLCVAPPTNGSVASIPPTCGQVYFAEPNDTCVSLKAEFGLSDDLFAGLNYALDCSQPIAPGTQVCNAIAGNADPTCTATYTVQAGDTCPSVAAANNLTTTQFFTINPGVMCDVPYFQVGQIICSNSTRLFSSSLLSYIVNPGDTLGAISDMYMARCATGASLTSICIQNNIANASCTVDYAPNPSAVLTIPCATQVGRTCGCSWTNKAVYGSDGFWYQNECDAACNFALPTLPYQTFCKKACRNRAGLQPYGDTNHVCANPCPWPQWNPAPSGWARFINPPSYKKYYCSACDDWCYGSAQTLATVHKNQAGFYTYKAQCNAACLAGKTTC